MTLNEMSSQAIADLERPLKVHLITGFLLAQVGTGQGFRSGLDLKCGPEAAMTVRQQPLTAMLSPSTSGSTAGKSGQMSVRRRPEFSSTTCSILPSPATNPVNTPSASLTEFRVRDGLVRDHSEL